MTRLRAPEPEDLDFLYWLENLPDVRRISWGEAPVSRHLMWEYLQSYSADIMRDRQLRLIIENDQHQAIGSVDLSDYDPINQRAMVGIAVAPDYRGQGIGIQALSQLIAYCRQALGLHQLAAIVAVDNAASIYLFKKTGFKSSGTLRSWLRIGSSYLDAHILQLML